MLVPISVHFLLCPLDGISIAVEIIYEQNTYVTTRRADIFQIDSKHTIPVGMNEEECSNSANGWIDKKSYFPKKHLHGPNV